MTRYFESSQDYELFIYTLRESFATIEDSTLRFVRLGSSLARVEGSVFLKGGFRITVRERVVFDRLPLRIDGYGYEVWHGDKKLHWYDSQPHPDDPHLQSSHPHHKHVHPEIKKNRVPAPELSFEKPNLPFLIEETGTLLP